MELIKILKECVKIKNGYIWYIHNPKYCRQKKLNKLLGIETPKLNFSEKDNECILLINHTNKLIWLNNDYRKMMLKENNNIKKYLKCGNYTVASTIFDDDNITSILDNLKDK